MALDAIDAARSALAGGDSEKALALLADRHDPVAMHLRAVALRRLNRIDEARTSFAAALAGSPGDPEVANNFANLLHQTGANEEALSLYDRALSLRPGYRDAKFNKAVLLSKAGHAAPALQLFQDLVADTPGDARAWSGCGTALRRLGRLGEAACAYDNSLQADAQLASARKGRAQIALERGEADAVDRFRHALEVAPGDLSLIHGLVEALEAAGDERATDVLRRALTVHPDWSAGHALMARIAAERGDADPAAALQDAVDKRPGDRDLALSLAATLAAGERWAEALAALPPGADAELAILRAHYLCESGEVGQALALIENHQLMPQAAVIAARAHLRLHEPVRAARLLEGALRTDSDSVAVWAHLELAWRFTGDARSTWLSGQDGLVTVEDIGLGGHERAETAELLRSLHRTRAHPLGQSLRGGTQTRGSLFARTEPVLARLRAAILDAVERYRAQLPPHDPDHPLLRHRDAKLRMTGSWSVRLTDAGFHVGHIHPDGLISAACYIALPDWGSDDGARAGWLELGRPPVELGLALEPLTTIAPIAGRLALFPSFLFHGTRPFLSGERLSVAFDIGVA